VPYYDYQCEKCGSAIELKQPITMHLPDSFWCPEEGCGGKRRQVLTGGLATVFGDGFPGNDAKKQALDSDQPDFTMDPSGKVRPSLRGKRRKARDWR